MVGTPMHHAEPDHAPVRAGTNELLTARITGWCGVGMMVAIVVNGPLSEAVQRVPSYWDPGAGDRFGAYLQSEANVDQMVVFFALSNLIFVFAIGFFAGLRRAVRPSDLSDWVRGVVAIGSALFLAGGLLSETLSTGIAVVLNSTPDYHLDVNTVLLLQGLWSTALAQGQVALGVVILALSAAWLRDGGLPRWVAWLGLCVGAVAVLRPAVVTHVPLFIASFQPTFIWIAAVSIALLRNSRPPSPRSSPLLDVETNGQSHDRSLATADAANATETEQPGPRQRATRRPVPELSNATSARRGIRGAGL